MGLPPDRGHVATEQQNPRSSGFDAATTAEAVALMADDHRAVTEAVATAADALAAFVDDLVPRMRAGGRLVYVGAGTSGRLGVLDAAECPPTFQVDPQRVQAVIAGGDGALRRSSEAREDDPDGAESALADVGLTEADTLLGIAAGGTTPYVLGAVARARAAGAATGLLVCARPDPAPSCDHLIVLDAGPELLTGSTRLKAGSATKLALNIITTVTFTRLGKVYGNLMVDIRATNDKLHDRAIRILRTLSPELTRVEANDVLDRADGDLKRAIVMDRLGLDADAAGAELARHDGRLRPILDA
jgi:N-acetylmuramic acid 6-phosphate etherase